MNPYIGHEHQISGVEEYRLQGGKGDGMRLLEITNGLGLRMTISADRCADIARLSFAGHNFSYFSPVGYVAPAYYDSSGEEFLRSFTAGFLTTCGLTNAGVGCEDQGEYFPLHGRIANTPAEHIYYTESDSGITVHATIRDHRLFSRRLTLQREISISKTENRFSVSDRISNEGDREEPVCVLYHYNIGYPLLSETAVLKINSAEVIPRDQRAAEGLEEWNVVEKPRAGFQEQCYAHRFDGRAEASVYNQAIGCGLKMEFDPKQLTYFTQWKMMGQRDYVMGLEPGNTHVMGRDKMREEKALTVLRPEETIQYRVDFSVL